MRYIWTIIWSFLLSAMLVYVLSSMTGDAFNLTGVYVMTVVFTIVTIGAGLILNEKDDSSN